MKFNWTCKYCNQPTTITSPNYCSVWSVLSNSESKYGRIGLKYQAISCPNPDCKELTLNVELLKAVESQFSHDYLAGDPLDEFKLMPKSLAKPQPDFIPLAIRADYEEACLILNYSPKASAAMSRRCLQGMIRDFWDIPEKNRGNLGAEISYIDDLIHPDTKEVIHNIRSMGDIGAHMEKDVNLLIDVNPEEAQILVALIETLIDDWYITREKRKVANDKLNKITATKLEQKREAKRKRRAIEKPANDSGEDEGVVEVDES